MGESSVMDKISAVLMKLIKIVSAPIMETGQFSIGRLLLIVTFVLAVIKWRVSQEIPNTHETVLLCLLGYVLGTKGIEAIKDVAGKIADMKKSMNGSAKDDTVAK